MMEGDDIKFDGHGRKSKMRSLTWRGDTTGSKGKAGRSTPNRDRSEAGTKAQLARIVHHTTEVVVRVAGGGKTTRQVKDHMDYITRNGKLETIDDKGNTVLGKQAVADLHSSWNLDFGKGQGKYKQALNVILSMPAGTAPERLLVAALHFAHAEFANHKFMMVLHAHDTDPHQNAPAHPHVHLVVKAEDRDRRRLEFRADTLHIWRESFAEQLRKQGIAANASRRYERGVSQKSKSAAEYHIGKRQGASLVLARRFAEAGAELQRGDTKPKPWELAMAARRRDVERELAAKAAQLHQDGDLTLAATVERFARNLPPIQTERQQMQQAILRQQRQRLQQREQDQPQGLAQEQDKAQEQEPDQER